MIVRRVIVGLAVVCALLAFAQASAQGLQTGTISGRVNDQTGLAVPGVTITVTSPVLQGERSAISDLNGTYTIPGLPPGVYDVTFQLSGMEDAVHRALVVPLGGAATADAALGPARIAESVVVTARRPPVIQTTGGTNLTSEDVDRIPLGRTPARIAEFAPGLTDNTPNTGQVTIAGGLAYDNVFFVDGVDVNDNIFGTANNLFIEDAVAETQVLTSGISAEYGRFGGGVVNLVTRSGGNTFSGSARVNLSNPSWSAETPFEQAAGIERTSKLSKFYEGTLGGPIVQDRLWFFSAARRERSNTQGALAQTAVPVAASVANDRYEIKLTGTPYTNHTVSGSYLRNATEQTGVATLGYALAIDPKVLFDRQTPNDLFVANYHGVVGGRAFVTAQYSEKAFAFRNDGGSSTAIADSPFRTRGVLGVPAGLHYSAPLLSVHDPQSRDNRQLTASMSTLWSTAAAGSHELKGGFEHFTTTLRGGGSQSATGFVFQSDYVTDASGRPLLDANGNVMPRFVPGVSRVLRWTSTPGAQLDIRTLSFYARDRWTFSRHVTFDLGVRYEQVRSDATGGIVGADTDTIVPRLGVAFDPSGDGKTVLHATYGHYSGKYSDVQFSRNTNVGNPSLVVSQYTGPAGAGIDFTPGLDLANYGTTISGTFPTANVFFDEGLSSPLTRELTAGIGREFRRGYGKVTYTWRRAANFIEDFIDDPTADGKVAVISNGVSFGTFDRVEYRNADGPTREYQDLQFQGQYRADDRLAVNGHWTVQLRNHGNFEGEATGQPAAASDFGNYPEILDASRNLPSGRLNDFQRHKVRVWAIYNQPLGRFGTIDMVPLWRYNSALTYSLVASGVPLSATQLARNPGYARLPGGGAQTLFFGERGTEEFEGYGLVDFAASYQIPVWKSVRPWVKVEIFNVLNNDKPIAWNTTVTPDPASPLDVNGLPTGFIRAAAFGRARSNADFPRPLPGVDGGRTFQVAFGLRF